MDEKNNFQTFTDPISNGQITIATDRSLDELDSVISLHGIDEHGSEMFHAHYIEVTRHEADMLVDILEAVEPYDEDSDVAILLARVRRLATYVK